MIFCCRITAKIDDDMIRYYVDEDLFLLEVSHTTPPDDRNPSTPSSPDPDDPNESPIGYDVTLIELPPVQQQLPPPSPITVNHTNHVHGHHVHEVTNT